MDGQVTEGRVWPVFDYNARGKAQSMQQNTTNRMKVSQTQKGQKGKSQMLGAQHVLKEGA